jgi:hypothetical protein
VFGKKPLLGGGGGGGGGGGVASAAVVAEADVSTLANLPAGRAAFTGGALGGGGIGGGNPFGKAPLGAAKPASSVAAAAEVDSNVIASLTTGVPPQRPSFAPAAPAAAGTSAGFAGRNERFKAP